MISEYEKAEWQSHRHAALVRHIKRYLSYADQHRKPSSENHNALEAERIILLHSGAMTRYSSLNEVYPEAKIPEFKACAAQVFPAREDELANPDEEVRRGRY